MSAMGLECLLAFVARDCWQGGIVTYQAWRAAGARAGNGASGRLMLLSMERWGVERG